MGKWFLKVSMKPPMWLKNMQAILIQKEIYMSPGPPEKEGIK